MVEARDGDMTWPLRNAILYGHHETLFELQ